MLTEMHGTQAGVTLQALTTFKNNKGEMVKGKSDIKFVSEKQASFKIKEVEKVYAQWQKKQQNMSISNDFLDDIPLPDEPPPRK